MSLIVVDCEAPAGVGAPSVGDMTECGAVDVDALKPGAWSRRHVGGVFFFLIFIAATTSAIGLVEPVASSVLDSLRLTRTKAVWGLLAVLFVLGVPIALSQGPWGGRHGLRTQFLRPVRLRVGERAAAVERVDDRAPRRLVMGLRAVSRRDQRGRQDRARGGILEALVKFLIPAAIVVVLLRSIGLF